MPVNKRNYVAETLLGEALGEGELGMRAIAEVIKNRSIQRKMTPEKVVLQRKQFSFWNNPIKAQSFLKKNAKKEHYALAENILNQVISGDNTLVGDANLYHAKNMKKYPSWSASKKVKKIAEIGNHIFYKE